MSITNSKVQPLLRWAGGKTWLIKHLEDFIPQRFENYHEPFLGGGSVFFYLLSNKKLIGKSYLSDSNAELINCYKEIKANVNNVIRVLRTYKNTKSFYYELRGKNYTKNEEKAAQFIYLNRTSFNGIYRVNSEGIYNVPYGHKQYKELFLYENFQHVSANLKKVYFSTGDFSKTIKRISKNDLVYLDPPYTVAHSNNGFIKYNKKLFSIEDQSKLRIYLDQINDLGAYFILSNAYHENILDIFKGIEYKVLKRASVIGGKNAKRSEVKELLFYNCR